ncbi:hypothetical protein GMAR_ORF286 [Golden Marseillevirus]|uniref:hypothetical protein n=1 Tax=Golden Marseillevirus TaxID=1720526 RepID=UPI000877A91D|nr:hypothetical protein GMAR_ORF286 [Golden Marseillevirus]ALX27660.1 hypothetical protein GMAR_ORF286 [Golden Marseillevirus]
MAKHKLRMGRGKGKFGAEQMVERKWLSIIEKIKINSCLFLKMSVHDVMPKILGQFVFSNVPKSSLACCPFVCKAWKLAFQNFSKKKISNPLKIGGVVLAGKQVVLWAEQQGCPWELDVLPIAVKGGNLEYIKWLVEEQACTEIFDARHAAAEHGFVDIVEWLYSLVPHFSASIASYAAGAGQTKVMDWVETIERQDPGNYVRYAAENGQVCVFEWMLEKGKKDFWDVQLSNEAAEHGHLSLLEWAEKRNFLSLYRSIMCSAAFGGHVNIMQWLLERGLQLTDEVFLCAVWKGQIHALEWLKAKNCPTYGDVCSYAFRHRNDKSLRWLIQQGFACSQQQMEWLESLENQGK